MATITAQPVGVYLQPSFPTIPEYSSGVEYHLFSLAPSLHLSLKRDGPGFKSHLNETGQATISQLVPTPGSLYGTGMTLNLFVADGTLWFYLQVRGRCRQHCPVRGYFLVHDRRIH